MTMPWLEKLSDRYLFIGRLVMESGLHIGGGRDALTTTDSAVMKYIDDRPFVPGSSMKGAFRSAVERVAGSLSPRVRSCGLFAGNDDDCPTPTHLGTDVTTVDDDRLADLCHTCGLFGSPFMAAKVRFSDLAVLPETWAGVTEVRDGVGIDRDSERAVDRIKYDYEVVPSETEFEFRLVLENPDAERHELGLVAIGLREMEAGMIPIGGIRTRGLGRCRLADLKIYHLAFNNAAKFKAYLKGGRLESDDFKLSAEDADSLLNNAIDGLFE
jgi:CRISPR-associated RAMP protein (TIGR02581 family)